jgi:hypothetical protein
MTRDNICAALERWRASIEPIIVASPTPVEWADVMRLASGIYEAGDSVIVTYDTLIFGKATRLIWVAFGDMAGLGQLLAEVEDDALADGMASVSYLGRRGFVREFGFREAAVLGVKEVT